MTQRAGRCPAAGRQTMVWNPPASNGGTPVVRYLLRVSVTNSTSYGPWVANTTSTSRTLVNLRKSSVYRVQVNGQQSRQPVPVTLSFRQAR